MCSFDKATVNFTSNFRSFCPKLLLDDKINKAANTQKAPKGVSNARLKEANSEPRHLNNFVIVLQNNGHVRTTTIRCVGVISRVDARVVSRIQTSSCSLPTERHVSRDAIDSHTFHKNRIQTIPSYRFSTFGLKSRVFPVRGHPYGISQYGEIERCKSERIPPYVPRRFSV